MEVARAPTHCCELFLLPFLDVQMKSSKRLTGFLSQNSSQQGQKEDRIRTFPLENRNKSTTFYHYLNDTMVKEDIESQIQNYCPIIKSMDLSIYRKYRVERRKINNSVRQQSALKSIFDTTWVIKYELGTRGY